MAAATQSAPTASSGQTIAARRASLHQDANSAMAATFEMMNLKGVAQGFVISIEEAPPPIIDTTPAVIVQTQTPIAIPPPPSGPPPGHVNAPVKALLASSSRPSSPLRISTIPEPPSSPVQESYFPQQSSKSSPTLVRNGSVVSTGTHSPVMRSMFPRYEPGVSLGRQPYVPAADTAPKPSWQGEASSHQNYSPSLYSSPGSPPQSVRSNWKHTRLTTSGIGHSPLHISQSAPPNLSGPEELLDLWSISNGQSSEEASETYTLGLRCSDLSPRAETITFVSAACPLYSLHATASDLTVTRTHPITPTPTIPITTTTLSTPSPSSPLLAPIFPKSAELAALDHASSIAISHRLNRADSADLQAEALLRTRDAEASNLLWDSDSQAYYFIHPTLLDENEPATFPFAIDAATSTITLLSSTLPAEAQELLSLSLATNILTIHVRALTPLNSKYALDSLLAAMLILLLHLHRTASSVPPQSPTLTLPFAPPPTLAVAGSRKSIRHSSRARPSSTISRTQSRAQTPTTFQAQFEMSQLNLSGEDVEKGMAIAPELKEGGVDLSRFQSYDLDDKSLPVATRAVLRVLYWAFGVLVWLLGVVVGILAAGVVGVGGLVRKL